MVMPHRWTWLQRRNSPHTHEQMEPHPTHIRVTRGDSVGYTFSENDNRGPWPPGDKLWCHGSRHTMPSSCTHPADIILWQGGMADSGSLQTCGGHLAYAIGNPRRSGYASTVASGGNVCYENHVYAVWVADHWQVDEHHRPFLDLVRSAVEYVSQSHLEAVALDRFRSLYPHTMYPEPCDHLNMSCSKVTERLAGGNGPLHTYEDYKRRER